MKRTPRFFCDNCGYEVGHEVKACPHCGRTFASVRCPSCGFSGADKMFLNGCPACGYSTVKSSQKAPKTKKIHNKKRHHYEPLSAWAYIAASIAMLAVLAVLSWLITR